MMQGEFREPLSTDERGFYITIAQMQFYLNRDTKRKIKEDFSLESDPDFYKYYLNCCMYNTVYDMTEEDPECALLYWDQNLECVSVTFPTHGKVAKRISTLNLEEEDDDFEWDEEDDFGLFE